MKKITLIKMQGCPYCANALRAIDALKEEQAAYRDIAVELIDENLEAEKTKPYAKDYYYVPSIFVDGKKVFEAQPGMDYETIKKAIKNIFAQAVA